MLPDELTLLDGAEVVSLPALARETGRGQGWITIALQIAGLPKETTLGGVAYYARASALAALRGTRVS